MVEEKNTDLVTETNNPEPTVASETSQPILDNPELILGRNLEKTKLLQEALFKDTNSNVLNSSVENYREQMANEMNNDFIRGK